METARLTTALLLALATVTGSVCGATLPSDTDNLVAQDQQRDRDRDRDWDRERDDDDEDREQERDKDRDRESLN